MKKKVSRLLALCLAVLMTAAMLPLTAMAEDDQQQITVTFKVGDEVYGEPVVLPAGTALGDKMPEDPTATDGLTFEGWREEGNPDGEYINKDTIFNKNTVLCAVFVDQTAPVSEPSETSAPTETSETTETSAPTEPSASTEPSETTEPSKPSEPSEPSKAPVEKPTALEQVKSLIAALPKPEEVTAENFKAVKKSLIDIDTLRENDETVDDGLTEDEITKYDEAAKAVTALENGGNSSEPETIPDVNYIAYIGNTGYSTIQDAVEAVTGTDNVQISVIESTSGSVSIPAGKSIILDFAPGVVLTLAKNETITNKGILTITGEGTITKVADPDAPTSTIINERTLTIKGGIFENKGKGNVVCNGSDIEEVSSELIIKDGKFTAPENGYIFAHRSRNNSPVTTTVEGGEFTGALIKADEAEGLQINNGTFDTYYVLFTDGVDDDPPIFTDQGPTRCSSDNGPSFTGGTIKRTGYKDFDGSKLDSWNVAGPQMEQGLAKYVYTPKWKLATYQITYSTQGNLPAGATVTGAPADASAQYNTQITLPNLPKSAGYVCVGWTADSDGKTYQTGDAFTMPAKDVTFTAKWGEDRNNDGIDDATQPHYQVTYTDGVKNRVIFEDLKWTVIGDNQPTPPYQDENGAYGDPVREGYLFTGWTPEVADTVTASVTYTATWKADKNQNGIPDENETEYRTVRVVWTDRNNAGKTRPSSVTVQLMKNGTAYGDPVKLSASNKWTYKWTTLENDQNYEVVEMVVPKGYNVKYSKTKYTFTITNKRSTTQYTTSGKPLQTGQLNWPIPVLAVCGLAFIGGGLALILRKKRGSYGK